MRTVLITQKEINEEEWRRADNWHWGMFYSSKRDDRILVPRRLRSLGRTFNPGRLWGLFWFISLHIAGALLVLGIALWHR